MEKVIYLLSRPPEREPSQWFASLHDTLPRALEGRSVHAIRLNVADDDVAAAASLRQQCLTPAVDAVVQLWMDSAVAQFRHPVDAAVAAGTAACHGYLVTESQPLLNATRMVAPGGRTPGFAQVALLRRPPSLDFESWLDIWQNSHTTVAIETQSNFEYLQNLVVRPLTDGAPHIDAIVEECFPTEAMTDPLTFFDAPDDESRFKANLKRMMDSVHRFIEPGRIDVIPTSQYDYGQVASSGIASS